jgi:AcrR family transcriptional regulator
MVLHFHLGSIYHKRPVYAPQVIFQQEPTPSEGLRSRKKARTRRAIEDAAISLFVSRGYEATTVEQIAALAEVSTTTFFRYFPTKADVILSEQDEAIPALRRAILARPAEEDDLEAVRHALQDRWIAVIDPDRTVRTALAMQTSPVLRGLSYEVGRGWLTAITEALARRHGRRSPDARCILAARACLTVFGASVEAWIARSCRGDLAAEVDQGFVTLRALCAASEESTKPTERRGKT